MFNRVLTMVVGLAFAVALGCGGNDGTTAPTGSLDVQVMGLTADETGVAKVEVVLNGEIDYTQVLARDGGTWKGTFLKVFAGAYEATATAYDAADHALFVSVPKTITIGDDASEALTFVLNQHLDVNADVPKFVSIELDRTAVEQNGQVQITVQAIAEDLDSLSGKYSGSYADDGTTFVADMWPPYHSNDFSVANFVADPTCGDHCWSATTTWTANKAPGAVWFVLRAWNGESVAEMGLTVVVTPPRVPVAVTGVEFNMAPTVVFNPIRVLNEAGGTTVYIALQATDAEGGLTYAFTGQGTEPGCAGILDKAATGSLTSGAEFNAKYTVSGSTGRDCVITLVVADGQQATTTRQIGFRNEAIGYGEGERTTFTGFATPVAGTAVREFSVAPRLPADSVSADTDVLVRMALYNASGRVANFAKYAAGYAQVSSPATYDRGVTDSQGYLWIGASPFAPADFDGVLTWWFELQPQTTAGVYRLVVEFIDAADGSTLAGDVAWVLVQ